MTRLLLLWVRTRVRPSIVIGVLLTVSVGAGMAVMSTPRSDLSPIYVILGPAINISVCALLGVSELVHVEAQARPFPQLWEASLIGGSSALATSALGLVIFYVADGPEFGVAELARNWGLYMTVAALISLRSWRTASVATFSAALAVLTTSAITRTRAAFLFPARPETSLTELGIVAGATLLVQAVVPLVRRPGQ